MPRKIRELVDGGIYHIFNRGNGKMDLFREPSDYACFLSRLRIIKDKLEIDVFHYCLMTNHFHLLLRVSRAANLISLMHRVQLSYAIYFKKKYDFTGHVFQERFRSPRIAEESYYLQCGRYIERNPVKAGLACEAFRYPYSSAAFYSLGRRDLLVTPNLYYGPLGKNPKQRQRAYRSFVSLGDPYDLLIERSLSEVG